MQVFQSDSAHYHPEGKGQCECFIWKLLPLPPWGKEAVWVFQSDSAHFTTLNRKGSVSVSIRLCSLYHAEGKGQWESFNQTLLPLPRWVVRAVGVFQSDSAPFTTLRGKGSASVSIGLCSLPPWGERTVRVFHLETAPFTTLRGKSSASVSIGLCSLYHPEGKGQCECFIWKLLALPPWVKGAMWVFQSDSAHFTTLKRKGSVSVSIRLCSLYHAEGKGQWESFNQTLLPLPRWVVRAVGVFQSDSAPFTTLRGMGSGSVSIGLCSLYHPEGNGQSERFNRTLLPLPPWGERAVQVFQSDSAHYHPEGKGQCECFIWKLLPLPPWGEWAVRAFQSDSAPFTTLRGKGSASVSIGLCSLYHPEGKGQCKCFNRTLLSLPPWGEWAVRAFQSDYAPFSTLRGNGSVSVSIGLCSLYHPKEKGQCERFN